ncbi:methylmalonyl Co-A mutase-associated GTPase MeaB [Oscillatoria amoena NRMC-F 0135]|nr:methylmalonyl Co-A mutase-associated GTPase MeaB [Oscillatoria amoena NRMC-F 0135]
MMAILPSVTETVIRDEVPAWRGGDANDLMEDRLIQPLNSLTKKDFVEGILRGDRSMLARAITLIESAAPRHQALAREILHEILPRTGGSTRIGITGVPGVGKSTLIEAFGLHLCEAGKKVAVLAVDPSSQRSGGSILGDKTRMERLSNHPSAFIRPSPSGNTLGGVARRTRETICLCEAFGFDTIIVETVGVGQSETLVRGMVDYFLVLLLAGAGDELQGIKKGIIEMGDGFLVTKADGDNAARAESTAVELRSVLHVLTSPTPGWAPRVDICSARTGAGISGVWNTVEEFLLATRGSGVFEERRREQMLDWFDSLLRERILTAVMDDPAVPGRLEWLRGEILDKRQEPAAAVEAFVTPILRKLRGAVPEGEKL